MQVKPKKNEIWIYRKTGLPYRVVGLCMIKTYKEGTEKGWSKGVSYYPIVETEYQQSIYVRELDEFLEKFHGPLPN